MIQFLMCSSRSHEKMRFLYIALLTLLQEKKTWEVLNISSYLKKRRKMLNKTY